MKKLTISALLLLGSISVLPLYAMEQREEESQWTDTDIVLHDLYDAITRDAEELAFALNGTKAAYALFYQSPQPGQSAEVLQQKFAEDIKRKLSNSCFQLYADLIIETAPTDNELQTLANDLCNISTFEPSILSLTSDAQPYDYVYSRWKHLAECYELCLSPQEDVRSMKAPIELQIEEPKNFEEAQESDDDAPLPNPKHFGKVCREKTMLKHKHLKMRHEQKSS